LHCIAIDAENALNCMEVQANLRPWSLAWVLACSCSHL